MKAVCLLAGLVSIVLITGGCGDGKTEPTPPNHKSQQAGTVRIPPEAQRQLMVEEVQLKPIAGDLTLSGKVQYSEDRYAKVSSPLIGRVSDVLAKLGEKVAEALGGRGGILLG